MPMLRGVKKLSLSFLTPLDICMTVKIKFIEAKMTKECFKTIFLTVSVTLDFAYTFANIIQI